MAGNPFTSEESLWRHMNIMLDGLPEFTVGTSLDVEVWVVDDLIEDAN